MRDASTHYRRSPHIVSYWADGRLVFHNFATGKRVAGTALTIGLLDYFDSWKAAEPLAETLEPAERPAAEIGCKAGQGVAAPAVGTPAEQGGGIHGAMGRVESGRRAPPLLDEGSAIRGW